MAEPAHGFFGFLRSMDLRVFQERELGLDVVLSGPWAILPCALAMALGTVFLLAVFQAIPRRRHSIPVLLGLGLLAAAIGLAGAYLQYRAQLAPSAPVPRIIAEGRGGQPAARPGQSAALLCLPLLLGTLTLFAGLAGACFLALFGDAGDGGRKRPAAG